MTLIAGFKSCGFPFLMGDFLLNDQEKVIKKIHLIRPNLAIAWTGHRIVARSLLEQIDQELPAGLVTKTFLEDYLTAIPENHFGSIAAQIVGWVVADEPECFFWRTDYPHEVTGDLLGQKEVARKFSAMPFVKFPTKNRTSLRPKI